MCVVVGWPLAMQLQRFPKDAATLGTVNHRSLDFATPRAYLKGFLARIVRREPEEDAFTRSPKMAIILRTSVRGNAAL